jgi:hypothetical protein
MGKLDALQLKGNVLRRNSLSILFVDASGLVFHYLTEGAREGSNLGLMQDVSDSVHALGNQPGNDILPLLVHGLLLHGKPPRPQTLFHALHLSEHYTS